jgi:hypothetical protein
MPELRINQKKLYGFLSQELKINNYGACSYCKEDVLKISQKNTTVPTMITTHAFEPIQSTYEALLQVRLQFNLSEVYIHHLTITNSTDIKKMVKLSCRRGIMRSSNLANRTG